MDEKTQRTILKSQVNSYLLILENRGLVFDLPAEFDVETAPISDLKRIVNVLSSLARTPS